VFFQEFLNLFPIFIILQKVVIDKICTVPNFNPHVFQIQCLKLTT